MKRIFFLLCMCFPLLVFAQSETLTNGDIIKLSKLDLPPSSIVSKIRASKTHFDVSVDALVTLKKEGVSGEVISEMIAASTQEQKMADSQKDYRDPKTIRKEGIYYYNKSDSNNLFIPIDATVVSNSKSGGFGTALAQRYSYGIAQNYHVSELSGAQSHRQIPHARPHFYFYLTSLSPNEFALVKLTEKKNSRSMVVGASNAYGASMGIDKKEKVDFSYEQIADGIYRVYPQEPLEEGEYCFLYIGSAPTIFSNNKVYDFGISLENKQ